jgi:alcohol dehydrogenase, propanol-preferring
MKAQLLERLTDCTVDSTPLSLREIPRPLPGPRELLIKVAACGVCHTELDEIEGRTPPPVLPVVPGHQVVGFVVSRGSDVTLHRVGDRVGVAWIFSACGACAHCRAGNENLCAEFRATGRDAHGGYAEFMTAHEAFAHAIPPALPDAATAPLLCAGAIGYRSLRLTGLANGGRLGLTGFGASAHLVMKLARHTHPDTEVFVFARSPRERAFARELGAAWAGDTDERPHELLDAIIDTTPVWRPVIAALACLAPGGRLVINAIRKEHADASILAEIDYPRHLWMEKEIKTVANVARADVREFLALAAAIPILPEYQEYSLAEANTALSELKKGIVRGAKVITMSR